MQVKDLLIEYRNNSCLQTLAKKIKSGHVEHLYLKGLVGSLPAVIAAALQPVTTYNHFFILQDKEEAAYFYTDLQNLLGVENVHLYPAIEQPSLTAIKLLRNEILQKIIDSKNQQLIVTYPAAVASQVRAKNVLAKHMKYLQVGDKILLQELVNKLFSIGFEKVDFVYEAGSFSLRGGIIDVFSYANQLPYRIEFIGEEIESIRTFNPNTQLSINPVTVCQLLDDTSTTDKKENYASIRSFIPENTIIWFKDYQGLVYTISKLYETNHPISAEVIYDQPDNWAKEKLNNCCIEFGHQSYLSPTTTFCYKAFPQTNFNEQFGLLANELHQNEQKGVKNILFTDSYTQLEQLLSLLENEGFDATIDSIPIGLSQGFMDEEMGIACYTDHQIFGRYYRYKSPIKIKSTDPLTLSTMNQLLPGDYVVHIDYGIGCFSGLTKVRIKDKEQEVLRIVYKDSDVVYVSLHALHKISKYTSRDGIQPTMTKLGTTAWEQKKKKLKANIQAIAKQLITLYGQRRHASGFAFSTDNYLQVALASSFIYEETPDQTLAIAAVKKDMESPHPMDRLLCGDVGFGKTEVAIRAAFKAIQDRKQVAVLVPTTILALQHYNSFKKRLSDFKVNIQYINRFKPKKSIEDIQKAVAAGSVDILIGTHGILDKSFIFKDLGLLIIDEEQKFGVKAKDSIKALKFNIDVLTLTATPIPRTLHFSLMGARDLSIIATPPANRQPITTTIHTFDEKVIQEAIHYEVQRGGQVFFVHNRVANIESIGLKLKKLLPNYRIAIAHGRMTGNQLEKCIINFISGGYDVLLATNIIESGLDIPNANTIIINNSHTFGLSDLHQMRGRVGRSNKQAFCYLIAPPLASLTQEARKRLCALEEFSELGDGFKVAMRDLDIRGAGNLLGAEQSGFVADVGFEAYCQILDEAVQELKETEFKNLFETELAQKKSQIVKDCTLETDLELLIPITYVSNDNERLRLYTELDSIKDEIALEKFQLMLKDRFGKYPLPVAGLIEALKLRWKAQTLGLQKIKLKESSMRCYLAAEIHETMEGKTIIDKFFTYVQKYPNRCHVQTVKQILVIAIANIPNVAIANATLTEIEAFERYIHEHKNG